MRPQPGKSPLPGPSLDAVKVLPRKSSAFVAPFTAGSGGATPTQPTGSGPAAKPLEEPEVTAFAGTVLSEDEVAFLTGLERAAGATPRAVKRYVNIYRLLRARVSKASLEDFQGKPKSAREFEAVMQLLAMFNTAPRLAQSFCRALAQAELSERATWSIQEATASSGPLQTLLDDVLKQASSACVPRSEAELRIWSSVRMYATAFEKTLTIDAYCRWYPVIARYSFRGGMPA